MGCGCKTNDNYLSEKNNDFQSSLHDRIIKFFFNKNKFSIVGTFIFIFTLPIFFLLIIPIVIKILFDRIVMNRQTNIIELIAFTKDKKIKK